MAQNPPAAPARAQEPEQILLVDDNSTNLQVLYQTLSGLGYKLLIAKSGEVALDIARRTHPDLVMLDIMMPGLDGYQVCEALKRDPETREAAVIFLSALDETEDKVRGLRLGAVDYVSKPFQSEEVIARVSTHMSVLRLQRNLTRANERMHRDLEAAARVQRSLLPATTPDVDSARFAWRYRPCEELAGDSLNVFKLDDRNVGLYVLDVTGHGVAASLLSVTITRSLIPQADPSSVVLKRLEDGTTGAVSPAEVLGRLNALYPMSSNANLYFTIVYGVLDTKIRQFRYASAGHPGPLSVRADGTTTPFRATGIPNGLLAESIYEEVTLDLAPGERIYLFSDGIYEQRNPEHEQFGDGRLFELFANARACTIDESIENAIAEVLKWSGMDTFDDDVAILGLETLS